jgi:hypothetical protein
MPNQHWSTLLIRHMLPKYCTSILGTTSARLATEQIADLGVSFK